MDAGDAHAKERIFQAALDLLTEDSGLKNITMRQVALKAGVNLALINYYYRSKENLMSLAAARRMGDIISQTVMDGNADENPAARLKALLVSTADFAFRYLDTWRVSASADVKLGCRNAVAMVMPFLREIFTAGDESDLTIAALQLIQPFYGIVLHTEAYNETLRTDFFDPRRRAAMIGRMVDAIVRREK